MTQTLSADGFRRLQEREGCRLEAYLDVAGIPTIGYGTIRYPGGRKVQLGDTCTADQAAAWFRFDLGRFEVAVDALTVDTVSRSQFDALVSFVYNLGEGAYRGSTLRQKVNADPNDPAIRPEFMRWVKAGGVKVKGLWVRRHDEADQYFGTSTPCPPFPGP